MKVPLLLFSLLLSGCAANIPSAVQRETPDEEVGAESVVVRFWNLTAAEAVDVEFFATNEVLQAAPAELFDPGHRVTTSIGVAGTGIIEPGNEDTIEFPCTGTLTLGTAGGRFLDNETGELLGQGAPRWVQDEPLGLCGSVVTFVFANSSNGLVTRLFLGPLVPDIP